MSRAAIRLNIPTPCSRPWETMQPANNHNRFCNACQKQVTDFSGYTDEALYAWFQNNTTATCGRFRPEQLNKLLAPTPHHSKNKWLLSAWLSGLLSLTASSQFHAQTPPQAIMVQQPIPSANAAGMQAVQSIQEDSLYIRGKVTDRNRKTPLSEVAVRLEGSNIACLTNEEGFFALKVPASLSANDFSITTAYVGYENQTLLIHSKNIQKTLYGIELILNPYALGEVESVVVRRSFWYRITHPFKRKRKP